MKEDLEIYNFDDLKKELKENLEKLKEIKEGINKGINEVDTSKIPIEDVIMLPLKVKKLEEQMDKFIDIVNTNTENLKSFLKDFVNDMMDKVNEIEQENEKRIKENAKNIKALSISLRNNVILQDKIIDLVKSVEKQYKHIIDIAEISNDIVNKLEIKEKEINAIFKRNIEELKKIENELNKLLDEVRKEKKDLKELLEELKNLKK